MIKNLFLCFCCKSKLNFHFINNIGQLSWRERERVRQAKSTKSGTKARETLMKAKTGVLLDSQSCVRVRVRACVCIVFAF